MKRSICIWLGFAVVFILTMFPPWEKTRVYEGGITRHWRLWHSREDREPIIDEPYVFSLDADYRRMLAEIGAGESFVLALSQVAGKRLTYAELTGKVPQRPEVS
jgi:hypothetical protein